MNSPDIGRRFEASPQSGNDVSETPRNVTLGGDISNLSTAFPLCDKNLSNSLEHGSKTEQLLSCFILYGRVSKALAKQVYGETRLQQRVTDLTAKGFNIGRISYSKIKVSYFLPKESIPAAQTRINELRVFRKAEPVQWEVSA